MVLFQNRQWSVTDYGLECVQRSWEYWIAARRLLTTTGSGHGTLYDWPVHLALKKWVDIEAFIEAFEKALELHERKYEGPVDFSMLGRSIDAARDLAERVQIFQRHRPTMASSCRLMRALVPETSMI
jgi:hypothetical protein